jgi:hypothetical protein
MGAESDPSSLHERPCLQGWIGPRPGRRMAPLIAEILDALDLLVSGATPAATVLPALRPRRGHRPIRDDAVLADVRPMARQFSRHRDCERTRRPQARRCLGYAKSDTDFDQAET